MMEVSLEKVSKSFGALEAVKDIDLSIREREFVTLLGPSGCGKTTLLRMIAGLEKVTSGSIYFGDKLVNNLRPGDRDVAMVFQNYALYPHFNVARNIGYGLKVRGAPKSEIERRVREVARILEIEGLLERKPRQLSGGQRQRVALGRAIVRDPFLFLMDEPLSNLDAKLRVSMRAELKRFHMRLNTTTIYVTHDQLEAMTMSDKIAVINDGVLQQFSTPQEVYNRPTNVFVAGFIGNPPMNLLNGTLTHENGPALKFGPARQTLPPATHPIVSKCPEGKRLILGIRPQDISLSEAAASANLVGKVWLVELVGSEKLVDLACGEDIQLMAEVKAEQNFSVDQTVGVQFNPSRIHLFDPESGIAMRD
ncbi:MAG: sn-glycerol-3-phosphate ABC transporter ATP-binding protein UgpC [Bryobacterales bacterium]|nr:sn-glycerol-3-phosphate ABC transporter ATP-binding protein UgpC [Bryobacterales bacterium]